MNRIISKILTLLFFFIFPVAIFCQQPTREELNKQKQQIQKEIEALNASLKVVQNDKSKVLKTVSFINNKIEARERLINNINKEMKNLDDDIYLKQIEIYRLKKELDTLKKKYAQSVVYTYKNRNNYQYLNFLFSAKSFNDALKRVSVLKSYRKLREAEANTINKTQIDLGKNIEQLNQNRENKKGALVSQGEQLQVLELDKKEKDQALQQLRGQEKEVNAQISKREKQRREINNSINAAIKKEAAEAEKRERDRLAKIKAAEAEKRKQLEAEATAAKAAAAKAKADADAKNKTDANEKAAAEAKAKRLEDDAKRAEQKSVTYNAETTITPTKTNYPNGKDRGISIFESTPEGLKFSLDFESNRGRLPWPVSSGNICGRFGIEQISNTMKIERDGMIICLPVGTPVKSVADGQVSAVEDMGEYKYVMVRHGRYITIYNRLGESNVTVGQKVNAGTQVGKAAVGDNGEGEFEFRVMNGSKKFVNPEGWLKGR
jgi:septal ring factor EnvC (AmiA/AmiB activator)